MLKVGDRVKITAPNSMYYGVETTVAEVVNAEQGMYKLAMGNELMAFCDTELTKL